MVSNLRFQILFVTFNTMFSLTFDPMNYNMLSTAFFGLS